ncbi:MAG: ATP-binding protein [Pseudomonadota bacterium]
MDLWRSLNENPRLLDEIFSSLKQVVFLSDPEGKILFASSAALPLTGYRTEALEGQNISLLFTEEDLAFFLPNILHLTNHNQSFEGEAMLKRKNGTLFYAYLVSKPCPVGEEERAVFVFSVQDIDRQKRLEKSFRESHYEDLLKVANGIAHEIRNPLVGIGGFVNRIQKSCQGGEADKRYYTYIFNNLKRIERLVKKVEYLVSLPKPYFKRESIRELVEGAVSPYLEEMARRGIVYSYSGPDPTMLVDRELVTRAVAILVENSLEAASDGGRIEIKSNLMDNYCQLCVQDSGPGIASTDLPFIFNPFFSTKADGAGIDLAVVKRIVEGHGGSVAVESRSGEGARFYLKFPFERRREIRVVSLAR